MSVGCRVSLCSSQIFQINICHLALLLLDIFHFELILKHAEEEEEAVRKKGWPTEGTLIKGVGNQVWRPHKSELRDECSIGRSS